jgi:hypothetical protein
MGQYYRASDLAVHPKVIPFACLYLLFFLKFKCPVVTSLVPSRYRAISTRQDGLGRSESEVGGKKIGKFDRRDLPYNVWLVSFPSVVVDGPVPGRSSVGDSKYAAEHPPQRLVHLPP